MDNVFTEGAGNLCAVRGGFGYLAIKNAELGIARVSAA